MPQSVAPPDRQRRKSRNRRIVIGFFVFIGLIVVLESPLTRIRQIDVRGNTTIPDKRVISDSDLHSGQSLWQVKPGQIASRIASKEPMVQSTLISTDWLQGTVHIVIKERHVVAVYESSGKFYELLNNGLVYKEMQPTNGLPFPVVTAGNHTPVVGKIISSDVAKICAQLAKISPQSIANVSEFDVLTDGTVSLFLDNGFVVVSDASGLVGTVNAMQSAVKYFIDKGYKPGTIDLSGPPPYRYTPFQSQAGTGTAQNGTSSNQIGGVKG